MSLAMALQCDLWADVASGSFEVIQSFFGAPPPTLLLLLDLTFGEGPLTNRILNRELPGLFVPSPG